MEASNYAPSTGTGTGESRVEDVRRQVADRISELGRRIGDTRGRFDPRTWITNPWARLGVAVVIGIAMGRSKRAHPVLRAVITSAATAMLREALAGNANLRR